MAIKYISYGDTTGYGLSGIAYLRGLLNLGLQVHWKPLFWGPGGLQYWTPQAGPQALEIVRAAPGDPTLADLGAIMNATLQPKDYGIVISHIVPDYYPHTIEPNKCNIAYCAWESDALPDHWPAILNRFDVVLVPSSFNAQAIRDAGVSVPVHVVPHIRRHAPDEITPDMRSRLRAQLGVPLGHFVFYSIGAWMLRKDFPRLIDAFVDEFGPDEPVALVIKTSTKPVHFPLPHEMGKRSMELISTAVRAAAARKGQPAPLVTALSADGLSGQWIDCLHATGDAYVSAARGEGWGMGAFDAAALGRPVVMPDWGGPVDFLGDEYPGLVDYRLEAIHWPGTTYTPNQHWAVADSTDLRRKMRAAFDERTQPDPRLRATAERIANHFSEARIMAQYRHILASTPPRSAMPEHLS